MLKLTQSATRTLSQVTRLQYAPARSVNSDAIRDETIAGGIRIISLNRPKAMNAINKEFIQFFLEMVPQLNESKQVRVLLIRSLVRGAFCSGADLKERSQMREEDVAPHVARARKMLRDFERVPVPTIAALDGVAMGGGLELALACDLRVAATNARLALTETRLAIIPGGGGTQRLPRTIGIAKAKELIYTARHVEGEEAARIGLVNACVQQNDAGDAAYQQALALAKQVAANGPIALRAAKVAINDGMQVSIDDGFKIEEREYAKVIKTRDRVEAIRAFVEKRTPQFQGE